MSQDPKKKSKSRRVKPLDEKGGETPSKGAVPLNEGPRKEAAYSLDSSENVDPNAGFLNEETSPDAQALTMESVSLKTDLDHMSEPPPSSKNTVPDPKNTNRPLDFQMETATSEVLKPQSHVKRPSAARERKQKREETPQVSASPKLDLNAIDQLPSARFKKSQSFSAKRKKVEQPIEKAAPRFSGVSQNLDAPSEPVVKAKVENKVKRPKPSQPDESQLSNGGSISPPERKKKVAPSPPSKEKLSHATQIFVQDALAAVDLLDEPSPQPQPKSSSLSQQTASAKQALPQKKATPKQAREKSKIARQTQNPTNVQSPQKVSEPTRADAQGAHAGEVTAPGGDAIDTKGKAERVEREWGRALDGPEAKRAQEREGKVLTDEPDRYQQDSRPLAYRGAWWVGQPDIRPKRLPKMMRGVLKRSRGEKRVLWGTLVASFLAGLLFVGPEFFNPSAQAMAWQSGVQIELTSAPSGAQVFIAGEHLGETPLAIRKKLSPGAYEVKLEHGELIPLVEKISIEAKQKRVSRHFPLVDFSTLALTSAPKGATVFVEEQEVGRTPLDIDSLPLSKEVKLELRLEGHDTVAIRLPKVRPLSEKQHVQMYVQNKTGKVTLQSAKELLIYKEGKRIGVTGPAPIELPAGPHVLQLVEPITGQHASQHVQVVSKATRRYYFDWSDSP